MTATLLPNAEQSFADANGVPLAGGQVFFYVPNSSTPKNTWKDSGSTILNTNPIILDGAGRAIIYGTGAYRQVVQDANGNTIWDQLTTDLTQVLQSSVSIWCGTSTGTPNAQVLTPESPISSYVIGQGYTFEAGFTNTGSTTVSISGLPAVAITQSGSGISANTIQAGSINLIVYDGTNMQLLGTSFIANTSITGTIQLYAAISPPAGYLECDGSAVSRTTFSALFAIIGTTFGSGDGTTTFNLPDMRGYFARGWDDGAGIDPGRAFGSVQTDLLDSHSHTITDPSHSHPYTYALASNTGVLFQVGGSANAVVGLSATGLSNPTATDTNTTGITINNTGGVETRPKNVALLYVIKT